MVVRKQWSGLMPPNTLHLFQQLISDNCIFEFIAAISQNTKTDRANGEQVDVYHLVAPL